MHSSFLPALCQPEPPVEPRDKEMLVASHAGYQAGVSFQSGEAPVEEEIEWATCMLGYWMDGSMRPAQQADGETSFYKYLRVSMDCGGASGGAPASRGRARSTPEQLLFEYLGVHLDCSYLFRKRPANAPALTLSGVLGGQYSVRDLEQAWAPLALVMRMNAAGLTRDECDRVPRLRHLHHWSFANFLYRKDPALLQEASDLHLYHCNEPTCAAAGSFQHFCTMDEMVSHWVREVPRDFLASDTALASVGDRHLPPAAPQGTAPEAMDTSESVGESSTESSRQLPFLYERFNGASSSRGSFSGSAAAAAAAASSSSSLPPRQQLLLQPLASTSDDPLGTALASAILNRPALLWEAWQLRQLLSRRLLEEAGSDEWIHRITDPAFQGCSDCEPLYKLLARRFSIRVVVWTSKTTHKRYGKHQDVHAVHFWSTNDHNLVALFHSSLSPRGRLEATYRLPVLDRKLHDVQVQEAAVSDIATRWRSTLARVMPAAVADVPPYRGSMVQGASIYAVMLQVVGLHEFNPAAEMELRQVLSDTARRQSRPPPPQPQPGYPLQLLHQACSSPPLQQQPLQREGHRTFDAEHLAFHILQPPSSGASSMHQGELEAIAELFQVMIRLHDSNVAEQPRTARPSTCVLRVDIRYHPSGLAGPLWSTVPNA